MRIAHVVIPYSWVGHSVIHYCEVGIHPIPIRIGMQQIVPIGVSNFESDGDGSEIPSFLSLSEQPVNAIAHSNVNADNMPWDKFLMDIMNLFIKVRLIKLKLLK